MIIRRRRPSGRTTPLSIIHTLATSTTTTTTAAIHELLEFEVTNTSFYERGARSEDASRKQGVHRLELYFAQTREKSLPKAKKHQADQDQPST
jgi:hypothetical protein